MFLVKFTAAGDALIQQRIPDGYEGFEKVRSFIKRGDMKLKDTYSLEEKL